MNIIGDDDEEKKNDPKEPSKVLDSPKPVNLIPAPRASIIGGVLIAMKMSDKSGPKPPPPPSGNKLGLPPPPPPPPPPVQRNNEMVEPKKNDATDNKARLLRPVGRKSIAAIGILPGFPPYVITI